MGDLLKSEGLEGNSTALSATNPAAARAVAEYLRDPKNLLRAVIDHAAHDQPFLPAEFDDIQHILDTDKANIQLFLSIHRLSEMKRLGSIRKAFDKCYEKAFSEDRIADATHCEIMDMLRFLAARDDKAVEYLSSVLTMDAPKVAILDARTQQMNINVEGVKELEPSSRDQIRNLIDKFIESAKSRIKSGTGAADEPAPNRS